MIFKMKPLINIFQSNDIELLETRLRTLAISSLTHLSSSAVVTPKKFGLYGCNILHLNDSTISVSSRNNVVVSCKRIGFLNTKRALRRKDTTTSDSPDLKKSIKICGGCFSKKKCALSGSQRSIIRSSIASSVVHLVGI